MSPSHLNDASAKPSIAHGKAVRRARLGGPIGGAPSGEGTERASRVIAALRSAPYVCGTSSLGNLYRVVPEDEKLAICRAWFEHLPKPVVIDSAGKYGAGMALEELGRCLASLGVPADDVLISNKLAWRRTPLRTAEPTFEPGLWKGMRHDAQQSISYDGILRCWEEGCQQLGGGYQPRLVSVHDPDDFMDGATTNDERSRRKELLLDAYRALNDLKRRGEVDLVGVGAKNWELIREIDAAVGLDWIMFATLFTVYRHPPRILADVEELSARGVAVVNAGVFHSGFLVGGSHFDYRVVGENDASSRGLIGWRERFHAVCRAHSVSPAAACVRFAASPPGISTVALNCDNEARVGENFAAATATIAPGFWDDLKQAGLIAPDYPHLGSGAKAAKAAQPRAHRGRR